VFTTEGETVTIDLVVPVVRATVTGTVYEGDGVTPIPYNYVELEDHDGGYIDDMYTDENGMYAFQDEWLPAAGVDVYTGSPDDWNVFTSQSGTPTGMDQPLTLDLTVPAIHGTVHGTVFAGDGVTPIGGAWLQLGEDAGTGGGGGGEGEGGCCGLSRYANSAPDGTYAFDSFYGSTDGFYVDVNAAGEWDERQLTFSTPGQDLEADFILPVTVVKGRVRYPDGTAPSSLEVFLTTSDGDTYWADVLDDGNYVVLGAPEGSAGTVTAQDGDTGLTAETDVTVAAVGGVATADIELPQSGSVTGRIADADGHPVSGARVSLSSTAVTFQRQVTTADDGTFTFGHVPFGAFYLQASFTDAGGVQRFVSTNGEVTESAPRDRSATSRRPCRRTRPARTTWRPCRAGRCR
jgi:hypothetical protein